MTRVPDLVRGSAARWPEAVALAPVRDGARGWSYARLRTLMERGAGGLRALTPGDLLATARKYFDSANMQIVVVGDRTKIEDQAKLFGDLAVYDAQGTPLT